MWRKASEYHSVVADRAYLALFFVAWRAGGPTAISSQYQQYRGHLLQANFASQARLQVHKVVRTYVKAVRLQYISHLAGEAQSAAAKKRPQHFVSICSVR